MRTRFLVLSLCLIILSPARLCAQNDPCANPKTPRIGVLTGEQPKSSDSDFVKRGAAVGNRFRDELIKLLPQDSCLVRDVGVFGDPENFPALKGSMVLKISVLPSFKNPNVAAIAVQMEAVEGAYWEQALCYGTLPVLIESYSDFKIGAQGVMRYWASMGEEISKFEASTSGLGSTKTPEGKK
jgi:hypothetical protein